MFANEAPPAEVLPGAPYDPVLTSLLASLKSREPARDARSWRKVRLPPGPGALCPGPLNAYVKHTGSRRTIVILPGSYSTWSGGSFVSQTAAALEGEPNVVAFAGYLTIEFLSGACTRIPWDSIGLAEDLRARLLAFVPGGSAGVVGFSGGGYLAIAMLAADGRAAARGERRLFELGGFAISPLLHGRSAFANLDARYRASPISRSHTLVSKDLGNIGFLLRNWGPPDWRQMIELFRAAPDEITARTYNQFTSDVADSVASVGASLSGPLSHYQAYVRDGFQRETGAPDADLDRAFDAATDLGFERIDRPLALWFAQDDPILSHADPGQPQPPAVTERLARAEANPAIVVGNPRFGGHTGLLLDPVFAEVLNTLFGRE